MSSPPDAPPEFLIDRSLGLGIQMAEAITDLGYAVHTLRSFYGSEEAAQRVDDATWVRDVGDRGWLAFTKDDRVRRERLVREAMMRSSTKVFCLTNAHLKAGEQARRFLRNLPSIIRQGQRPGPFVYGVYPGGIARLWP